MINVRLPDGSQRQFEDTITVYDVAASIGPGLAKVAVAGKINDRLVDLSETIDQDVNVKIITLNDAEGLDVLRHSAAHLLAHATKHLFPLAQVTIGPVIENGFYYDFAYPDGFSPEDLVAIEKEMEKIAKQDFKIERNVMARDKAIAFFREIGEEYKAKIIQDIPDQESITLYKQGDFIDLCRGPHVPSTGMIKAFKLMKLAGAYWRGDSNNEMLQRIYGTAWSSKKELNAYCHQLEEAEKRDHRKLGKQLDLFHTQEEAPGMVFWHKNGWLLYQQVEQYIRNILLLNGYFEVRTPMILDRVLWEKSGHWEKFREDMFTIETENHDYAVKPMNCPCHVQIYNQGIKSYRDLPIRMAEFGSCHRNEASGTLHGLMRVRHLVQDDAHIFCTEEQIQQEVSNFIELLFGVYKDFGFEHVIVKLSTRPDQRVGSDEVWDKAESALEIALNSSDLAWEVQPGEGAFYGPKIEFSLRDSIGRIWQCGTIQVDFSMPARLDAHYIAEDGSRRNPVMLHRAILGSMERFLGILIEEHAGAFPTWLSPIQVVVMNITDNQASFVKEIVQNLKKQGLRVESDLRNEKIGYKIREHSVQKVPYQLVIGDREVETQQVNVRHRTGKNLGAMPISDFCNALKLEIESFGRQNLI